MAHCIVVGFKNTLKRKGEGGEMMMMMMMASTCTLTITDTREVVDTAVTVSITADWKKNC